MKKTIMLCAIFGSLVAACSSTQVVATQNDKGLPLATQLVLGTLQLEDTDQAVNGEQAKELLPMWQVYQDISGSGTAAQAEIDGLLEQIQETMTSQQIQAITAMQLSTQDVFTLMQQQGVGLGQPQQNNANSNAIQSNGEFAPPDGGMAGGPPDAGMAGGAPPDGGFGDVGSAGSSVSTGQAQTSGASQGGGSLAIIPNALLETLILYLEQIAST